ncbi:MAG: LUD domain-containing protein [Planctomycetota bacterium]
MNAAREQILGALRAGLRGATVPELPPVPVAATIPPGERVARFTAVLTGIGGRVDRVADLPAAAATVRAMLAAANVQRVAFSDAPELATFTRGLPPATTVLPANAPRDELLAADAGVTFAQWGIAETGTLVLESAREQHRLASLLPALHIAVLPCARLLGTLGDAFAALRGPGGAPASRTITFVTGPSRTADIELTLVVGVHGPKLLHVVLVDQA